MEYGLTARLTPNIQTDIYLCAAASSPLSALSPAPGLYPAPSASQTINISGTDQAPHDMHNTWKWSLDTADRLGRCNIYLVFW